MPEKNQRKKRERPVTQREIEAMEISGDKRLREMGIDPDGDPVGIMLEVKRRYEELHKQRESS